MPSKQIRRIAFQAGYMFLRRSGVSRETAQNACAAFVANQGETEHHSDQSESLNRLRSTLLNKLNEGDRVSLPALPSDSARELLQDLNINLQAIENAWQTASERPGSAEDMFHQTWVATLIEECKQDVRSGFCEGYAEGLFDALWNLLGVQPGPLMTELTKEVVEKFGVDTVRVSLDLEKLRKQFSQRLRALTGASISSSRPEDIARELIDLDRMTPSNFQSDAQSTRVIQVKSIQSSNGEQGTSEVVDARSSEHSSASDLRPKGPPAPAQLLALGFNRTTRTDRVCGWIPPEPHELQRRFHFQGLTRFTVEELLGHGGMGAVYRVTNRNTKQDYAVKILRPDLADLDDGFIEDFMAEAAMLAAVHHPGIVKAFDCAYLEPMPDEAASTEEDRRRYVYIMMDLLRGQSLSSRLKNGPLEPSAALQLFSQLCAAMAAAHSLNIVHRDLKPENIFVCDDGTARVLDFGIARWTRPGPTGTQYVLKTNRVLGTIAYMAPEQKDGDVVDQRTDVFTLGIILYEMLTGHRPEGSFEPASKLSAADPLVDAVIAYCLNRDRLHRYTSAHELRTAVDSILDAPKKAEELKIHVALTEAQKHTNRKLRKRLMAAGGALAFAAGSLFVAWRQMREEQRTRDSAEKLVERILGDVRDQLEAAGRLDVLATASEAALDYYAQAPPATSKTKSMRNQAWALKYHADVMRGLGRRQEADDEYLAHVSLLKTLYQRQPENIQISREYAQALGQAGRVWEGKNDFERAGAAFDEQLDMLKRIGQTSPDDPDIGIALASAWENLGYLNSAKGRPDDAEFAFRQQITQCEKWNKRTEKLDPDLQRSLAKSHGNLGDLLLKSGRLDEALKHYSNQKEILDDLSANNPGDSRITHDLAVAWNKVGKTLLTSKEYDKATIAFDQFHAKALYLHEKVDPQQPGYKRMLATSLSNLGDALMQQTDFPQAEESYNKDLNIMQSLAADFPDDPALLADLGLSWCNLSKARRSRNAIEEASAAIGEAKLIIQKLQETNVSDALLAPLQAAIQLAETP